MEVTCLTRQVSSEDKLCPEDYWIFDAELRHNKTKGIQHKIVLWDVFVKEGELLTIPFFKRLNILLDTIYDKLRSRSPLKVSYHWENNFYDVFSNEIENPEIEGIVLKNPNGKLNLGRTSSVDSNWMFKVRKQTGRHKY